MKLASCPDRDRIGLWTKSGVLSEWDSSWTRLVCNVNGEHDQLRWVKRTTVKPKLAMECNRFDLYEGDSVKSLECSRRASQFLILGDFPGSSMAFYAVHFHWPLR